MIDKHLRNEFEAIPEVNERIKWLMDKIESGVIDPCTALQLAWDDGARTAVGPMVLVASIFHGQVGEVREMPEICRVAYTDGYYDGTESDQAIVIQWPDESDELTDRQHAEVNKMVTDGMVKKLGE